FAGRHTGRRSACSGTWAEIGDYGHEVVVIANRSRRAVDPQWAMYPSPEPSMNHANAELINRFYQAFQRLDAEAMCACYADEVVFSDPVFQDLQGEHAGDMWRMLASRAQRFSLTFG